MTRCPAADSISPTSLIRPVNTVHHPFIHAEQPPVSGLRLRDEHVREMTGYHRAARNRTESFRPEAELAGCHRRTWNRTTTTITQGRALAERHSVLICRGLW
jgi:hypothetical protein